MRQTQVTELQPKISSQQNGTLSSKLASKDSYEEAIRLLNSLQSNSQTLEQWIRVRQEQTIEKVREDTIRFLERGGLPASALEKLNVVHVAGTKGKGTTCAFVESILRQAGLRTGFYSSPHLVAVRERIRINGKPISRQKFADYFFTVYRNMEQSKESVDDMPAYFRFLTCMGFYAFVEEQVDVLVLEVGIGGAMDPTNIIMSPVVTGITSLGLEHQSVLGESLEEITRAKAGIMKPSIPCVTIYNHSERILEILREEAEKTDCPLEICPSLDEYSGVPLLLGVEDGNVSRLNASLAVHLANTFIRKKFNETIDCTMTQSDGIPFELPLWQAQGLANCKWHGRFQILKRGASVVYFLDGAHTMESLRAAGSWFKRQTAHVESNKVLIFSVTGDRDAAELLAPFAKSGDFALALFCPLIATTPVGQGVKGNFSKAPFIKRLKMTMWKFLSLDNWSIQRDQEEIMRRSKELADLWTSLTPRGEAKVFRSVNHVVDYLDEANELNHVFVTGSLHLVGAFLSLIDPELNSD